MSIDVKDIVSELKQEGYSFREYHTRKEVQQKVREAGKDLFTYLMKAVYYAYVIDGQNSEAQRASNAFFGAFNRGAVILSYYTVGPKYKKLSAKEYYRFLTKEVGDSPIDCYRELLKWEKVDYYRKAPVITEQLVRSVFKAQKAVFLKLSAALSDNVFLREEDLDDLVRESLRSM